MSTPEGGSHLAIGEVLTLLQDEYPDVTISKIRFLESQGLINPERTASGYRKFYEDDIRRLQWVLRQQKERFLPLKVIKAKLDAGEDQDDAVPQPTLFGDAEEPPAPLSRAAEAAPAPQAPRAQAPAPEPGPSQPTSPSDPPGDPAAWLAALQEGPRQRPAVTAAPRSRPVEPLLNLSEPDDGSSYSFEEVAGLTGLNSEALGELVDYGLVVTRKIGGEASFDQSGVEVAKAAAAFIARGIEVRHLRAYKLAAEREVTLFEQLTLPLLRQRNPQSRVQATEQLEQLTQSGATLRSALLRQALQPHVRSR